ncbi:hypothetical protein GQ55_9G295600 [Panicum hallii var. hallii]|uniref:Uncharacterized protein n=1 Tax=Panicum hallii var. hallii TaxID=1504633 RepID=A0A2T7C7N0_9POAL|nr:hypothetical protein GQ55_9G295600 [Panicum hallii var. hallii]
MGTRMHSGRGSLTTGCFPGPSWRRRSPRLPRRPVVVKAFRALLKKILPAAHDLCQVQSRREALATARSAMESIHVVADAAKASIAEAAREADAAKKAVAEAAAREKELGILKSRSSWL